MKEDSSPVAKIWIITALIIAGVLVVSFASLRMLVRYTADAFNTQQLFLVRESSRSIEEVISNIETSLRTAADIFNLYQQDKILKSYFSHNQTLMHALFLAAADGTVLQMHPPESVPADTKRELQKHIALAVADGQDIFYGDIVPFTMGNERDVSFIMGVALPGLSKWVCCIVNFSQIKENIIYPLRSGKTGYAWMIDNKGVLLAHPNRSMEGKKAIDVLKELWPEYSSFNLEIIIDRAMTRGEEGKGEYTGWHLGEKRLTKKLIAYSPIHIGDILWSIGVSAPYREALAPLMASIIGPLVFLLCFISVMIAGAWVISVQERRKKVVNRELAWSHEVFDGINDGISIIDCDYRVLMVNRAVADWHGKPKSFFKGMPCYKVFQQQDSACQGCPARETFTTGQPAFRDRVSTTLAGKKYCFQLTASPLKDNDGNTIRVAECVKDISREMALQSELLQHERKSMIVKMASQIAHEIRNPLGSLTLNIDLLEEELSGFTGVDASEAKHLIGTIKAELEGLHRVLKEYLECTRFPAIQPVPQDVNSIIEDLFGLLEEELRRKKILFKTGLEYNLPFANIDKDQIRRAFLNIILNAVDAMASGGTIEVATRSHEAWVEIMFADTGTGIPDDVIEKVFTPFFTTKSGGTGLGLSITQHIVTEHKGEIVCQSTPGQGAQFIIRIPRQETPQ